MNLLREGNTGAVGDANEEPASNGYEFDQLRNESRDCITPRPHDLQLAAECDPHALSISHPWVESVPGSGDNGGISLQPPDENGKPEADADEHAHSPVLMLFTVGAGAAVLGAGFFIGFSAFQIIVGTVGVVVGIWALFAFGREPR